jgi:phage terminase small subunit
MSSNKGDGAPPIGDNGAAPTSKLTPLETRFAEEYLIDLNGTQAAIRAGYSDKTAGQIAYGLLRKPKIMQEIDRLKLERCERTRVTADRVILELAKIGFSSMKDVATWDAGGMILKSSGALSDDEAAAIAEIEHREVTVDKVTTVTLKLKRYDKIAALRELREHTKRSDPNERNGRTFKLNYALDDEDGEGSDVA